MSCSPLSSIASVSYPMIFAPKRATTLENVKKQNKNENKQTQNKTKQLTAKQNKNKNKRNRRKITKNNNNNNNNTLIVSYCCCFELLFFLTPLYVIYIYVFVGSSWVIDQNNILLVLINKLEGLGVSHLLVAGMSGHRILESGINLVQE